MSHQREITDTCANCGDPIAGHLIGLLCDGPLYEWRHSNPGIRYGTLEGCDGNAHADAPRAIPPAEATHECPAHRKVGKEHTCPETYSDRIWPGYTVRTPDGRTARANGERHVDGTIEILWTPDSRRSPDDLAARLPEADLEVIAARWTPPRTWETSLPGMDLTGYE